MSTEAPSPIPANCLPSGVRSRIVEGVNGLSMHVLEAGRTGDPALILLHGFPEMAYSWREVMGPLANAGFHVVAPDQRGFGRTTGWDADYDSDITPFRNLNLVEDVCALMDALEIGQAAAVIGHDLGSAIAGYCAMTRPDRFAGVVMMSAPFTGVPSRPAAGPARPVDLDVALAALTPSRKHYVGYYSTPTAGPEMLGCPQGLHAFFRAYFHVKSGDWPGNAPHALAAMTAEALAELPTYYVMERTRGMAETVAPFMPTPAQIAACRWLPDDVLAVFSEDYARTGFQGGLNWYRIRTGLAHHAELAPLAGQKIEIPAAFIAGERDWGVHQSPGALEAMQRLCPRMAGVHLVPGAGHWVQQENPDAVVERLLDFLQ